MSPRSSSEAVEGSATSHDIDPEIQRVLARTAIEAVEAHIAGDLTAKEAADAIVAKSGEVARGIGIASEEAFGEPEVVNINLEVAELDKYLRRVEAGEITAAEALLLLTSKRES
jgi:galactitol-specific phosphotransferase system IIB component